MQRTITLVACAALWASSLGAQGDSLYVAWCSACHGRDARGTPAASTRLAVQPADLASCSASTPETEDQWVGIVTRGGAAYGLSLDMPAYGEAGTAEQIRMVVRYVRSLCREHGWPPGELNFPRAFLVEKAFPENELVMVARGTQQQLIFEHRIGRRFQYELEGRTAFDSVHRPFDGATLALKYNVWHSAQLRSLATLGLEATPPLGRQSVWELEPFLSAGVQRAGFVMQGQVVAGWENGAGFTGTSSRLGIGHEAGRFVPMLEAAWEMPRTGANQVTFYPQVWIRLSRLGHVAGSLGTEVGDRPAQLIAFVLWDFGDAPLLRGW